MQLKLKNILDKGRGKKIRVGKKRKNKEKTTKMTTTIKSEALCNYKDMKF